MITLLLNADNAEKKAELEKLLRMTQAELVEHYIQMSAFDGDRERIRKGVATEEEKLAAVRHYINRSERW